MRLAMFLALAMATPVAADERVAFLGMTMLDTSLQTTELGQDQAELDRLKMLEAMVADRFRAEGYVLVDLEPARADIDRVVNPAKCYGCDTRIATSLGADYALVGEVQKVSNLILTINLQLRAAATGDLIKGGVVDIRGNTDQTWARGMRSILKNRFFKREEK